MFVIGFVEEESSHLPLSASQKSYHFEKDHLCLKLPSGIGNGGGMSNPRHWWRGVPVICVGAQKAKKHLVTKYGFPNSMTLIKNM